MTFDIRPVTRADFRAWITRDRADSFAHRFVSKADMSDKWALCEGVWSGKRLAAAIITTISIMRPATANLQLLHTFAHYRKQGCARMLVEKSVRCAWDNGALYYRVSSEEDAQDFYRSLGFRFWGEQKSGTLLSMFRMGGPTVGDGAHDISDANIRKAVMPSDTTKRGAVVNFYGEAR